MNAFLSADDTSTIYHLETCNEFQYNAYDSVMAAFFRSLFSFGLVITFPEDLGDNTLWVSEDGVRYYSYSKQNWASTSKKDETGRKGKHMFQ